MGHIDLNPNICSYPVPQNRSQEEIQKALLQEGERRVDPPKLPSAPADILGYPSSIMEQKNPPPEPEGTPELSTSPESGFTKEHAEAGAYPVEEDSMIMG